MGGSRSFSPGQALIAVYCPALVSEAAGAFARQVVGDAAPRSRQRAKALLFAASRLAGFAETVGLELCAEVLFCEAVIERFIATGTQGFSPATARTLRTNLRALARALEAHPEPLPAPLPRERAKAPYSPAEIAGYLRLAACQATEARRMRASGLICLGAGAGVIAGELRYVRGVDVICRSGGLLVSVSGGRARSVPVLARFHAPLLAAAAFAAEDLIIGSRHPGSRNLSTTLVAALSSDPSLPRLQVGRLRSTWLCQAAYAIGLQAFMDAAGVCCSQRLGDIAASLPAMSEAQTVGLLGGSP